MTDYRRIPAAGIVLALATGTVLVLTGTGFLLAGAAVLVWVASLWLTAPPPTPPVPLAEEGVQLTHQGMSDLIEHSGLPMFMLDGSRIIIANAAARRLRASDERGQMEARAAQAAAVAQPGRRRHASSLARDNRRYTF